MGVNQIARRLGFVPSTALALLRELVAEGLVDFHVPTKTYASGAGVLTLAAQMLENDGQMRRLQRELDGLSAQLKCTALASEICAPDRLVVVATSRYDTPIALHVSIGRRFPLFASATGRCIAAQLNLPREELLARFQELPWNSPPTFETWLEEVEAARRDGVAVDRGNFMNGVTIVSALLTSPSERMKRGITVLSFNFGEGDLVLAKAAVRRAAQDAASTLTWPPSQSFVSGGR